MRVNGIENVARVLGDQKSLVREFIGRYYQMVQVWCLIYLYGCGVVFLPV